MIAAQRSCWISKSGRGAVRLALYGLLSLAILVPEAALAAGQGHRTLKGHTDMVRSVAFSPDGKTLASAGDDETIKLWDVATGREKAALKGHRAYIWVVLFSRGGRTLISTSEDGTVRLWDVQSGHELRRLQPAGGSAVRAIASSSGHDKLVTGAMDGVLALWDIKTGKRIWGMNGPEPLCLALSPDAKTLAVGHFATVRLGGITLRDAATGNLRTVLRGHKYMVNDLRFSPDGKALASAGADGAIRLWHMGSYRLTTTLKGRDGSVNRPAFPPETRCLQFTPDGNILASGHSDGSIKLWQVLTGQQLAKFEGHTKDVWSVALSSDAKLLASGSLDTTIKFWDLTAYLPKQDKDSR